VEINLIAMELTGAGQLSKYISSFGSNADGKNARLPTSDCIAMYSAAISTS
jgi:hypothetical protein